MANPEHLEILKQGVEEWNRGPSFQIISVYILAHTQNQVKLRFELADASLYRKESILGMQLPKSISVSRRTRLSITASSSHWCNAENIRTSFPAPREASSCSRQPLHHRSQ